ncbi:4-(cytidine 5'-diphospho)-2-C-methyl-D-erythritol kinase [Ramlibacter sp. PS4R-6]|uniref:4-(cytidine 5'-diphospho)-2-C-methyl-D-erythritol kinase n=1 Tax=Ramlibacter sp. PS4R-6 TaxID=3133438 RepID=UPI0030A00D6D
MRSLHDVPAPAKLNLFLHVLGRREDGMHLLQSAFMLVDWCDTLHFELRDGGGLSREDLATPLPADDLVLKAARALQAASGTRLGAHIAIEKRIPAEAGMGGGSSDAATTLLALNRLWQTNFNRAQLAAIGEKIGADVPFFVGGHNAWVEGTGEKLTPIELPAARFAVAKPPAGVSTAAIFGHPQLKRTSPAAIISGFAANPFAFGANDLQPVAQALCPDVAKAFQWLGSQGFQGRMTGSGSAVFAPMAPDRHLDQAPAGWAVRECSNMVAHPLAGWASSDD